MTVLFSPRETWCLTTPLSYDNIARGNKATVENILARLAAGTISEGSCNERRDVYHARLAQLMSAFGHTLS